MKNLTLSSTISILFLVQASIANAFAPSSKHGFYSSHYRAAVGVSYSLNPGLNFRYFVKDDNAVEVLVGSRWRGVSVTGLYEFCFSADTKSGFIWNFGGGPRFGMYNGKYYHDYQDQPREYREYSIVGLVATIGVEYCFKAPLSIGLDYRPFMDFKGEDDSILDGGLSVRYTF